MVITFGDLIVWLIIAALVGFVGELLARRRTPFGIIFRTPATAKALAVIATRHAQVVRANTA